MIKYYRIPFAAAVVLFGVIQFYGNGDSNSQGVAQNKSTSSNPVMSAQIAQAAVPVNTQQAADQAVQDPSNAQDIASEINATTAEMAVREMFDDSVASGTVSAVSKKENLDQIFSALQDAMDENVASSTAASAAAGAAQEQNLTTLQTLGRMLISLAFVILLGLSMAWFAKGYVFKSKRLSAGLITHLSSYALSPKTKVHLVQIGNEKFLIGEAPNAVSLISKIDSDLGGSLQDDLAQDNGNEESLTGFQDRLGEWQRALDNQHLSKEVTDSLQALGGLTQRLRKKKGQGYE